MTRCAELVEVVAGERLTLRADRTVYWESASTLFVADVHLGKSATFRALGVPVPSGSMDCSLGRLSEALQSSGALRLVFLGDLWHARQGRTPDQLARFQQWREEHARVEMLLVEGNHDRRAGTLPTNLGIEEVEEPYACGPFALRHYPDPAEEGYVLAGHLHPAAVLDGRAKQALSLPCFWFGPQVAVLPAFGAFTGCAGIRARSGDRVYVVAEGSVLRVA